jgi:hypothetical protein
MPILGAVTLLIQLCFAYHALKHGRRWWVFVIMAFPVMGCVLYYFMEVFPTSREGRNARKAARAIARAFDPDKGLRERVAELEACGSVENRMQLARECVDERMYSEAIALYRSCLSGVYETDPDMRYGLAHALLLNGDFAEALNVAQRLRASHPGFRPADVALIVARALEGTNRLDEALAEFGVLADTYPGEEGRWRYGALLRRLGRIEAAQDVFRRMLRNAERLPQHYRDAQKDWLDLARENSGSGS